MHVPLSPSSIIWYQQQCPAVGKVTIGLVLNWPSGLSGLSKILHWMWYSLPLFKWIRCKWVAVKNCRLLKRAGTQHILGRDEAARFSSAVDGRRRLSRLALCYQSTACWTDQVKTRYLLTCSCALSQKKLQLLGDFVPQTLYRGSIPGPR